MAKPEIPVLIVACFLPPQIPPRVDYSPIYLEDLCPTRVVVGTLELTPVQVLRSTMPVRIRSVSYFAYIHFYLFPEV